MSIFNSTTRCRAKNKDTCAYHGNPLRPESQGEALETSVKVLEETGPLYTDYSADADKWNNASVKQFAHVLTAYDSPQFTRDILKARYDIPTESAAVAEVEDKAGSMYRYRMRYLESKIQDEKRSSNVHGDQDLVAMLHAAQFQAEYDAQQHRKYATEALHSQVVTGLHVRKAMAADEMARSLAASAQAFRINQMCENIGAKMGSTPVPDDFLSGKFDPSLIPQKDSTLPVVDTMKIDNMKGVGLKDFVASLDDQNRTGRNTSF